MTGGGFWPAGTDAVAGGWLGTPPVGVGMTMLGMVTSVEMVWVLLFSVIVVATTTVV